MGRWREYLKVQGDHGCRDKVGALAMEGMSRRFSRGTGVRRLNKTSVTWPRIKIQAYDTKEPETMAWKRS